jgi:NADPH:quinone reductase-like Zn-dependent oxidoreductase
MKAAVYRQYGPPEVVRIEEVEQPVPGGDDVLVRIVAATLCTLDWRLRKPDPPAVGWFLNGFGRPKKHHILGLEFAGTVAAVGKNVTDLRIGERVFGSSLQQLGSHAEYACYPRSRVVKMPSNATFAEAAAIPYGGFTALTFLRKAGVKAGQKVLIYGASGSVGSAAVQIAKSVGAHVTGVCSTANLELVRSIGADAVIDYTQDDFAGAGPIYDVVQDAVGKAGFRHSLRALKRGGVFVDVGPGASLLGGLWARATGAGRVVGTVAQGGAEPLGFLVELFEQGKFKPVIDRRYPLADIVAAHRHAESGRKRGNVIVEIATVRAGGTK